jgi:pre-mRNA cleavage complex 2 protein Pcf11
VDDKGKRRESQPSMKVAAAAAAERDAKLRTMFVVVPPGEENKRVTCPICQEQLKSEFMEDDEEWVWKNATKVKDKV